MEDRTNPTPAAENGPAGGQPSGPDNDARTWTLLMWAFHIGGLVTGGLLTLAAGILTYVKRDELKGTPYEDHADPSMRLFWWTFGVSAGCWFLTIVTMGLFGILAFFIWIGLAVYICVKAIPGLKKANDGKPYKSA